MMLGVFVAESTPICRCEDKHQPHLQENNYTDSFYFRSPYAIMYSAGTSATIRTIPLRLISEAEKFWPENYLKNDFTDLS